MRSSEEQRGALDTYSRYSIVPEPSKSYSSKSASHTCAGVFGARDAMAPRNSARSMEPEPSVSQT